MLIFNAFSTRADAERFARAVKQRFGLDATVYDSQPESEAVAPFPFVLTPPIVLVERPFEMDDELRVMDSVEEFHGTFAGT